MRLTLLLALATLISSGCASRPVLYNPAAMQAAAGPAVTRVLIDRWGDLYPSVAVDTAELKRVALDSLSGYYEYLQAQRRPEWQALLHDYQVRDGNDFNQVWQTVQDSIVARTVRGITAAAGAGPVIVLAHGYNNNEAEGREAYDAVRVTLQRRGVASGEAAIVEVYWDGRTDLGQPILKNFHAWGYAQNTAYGVGLGLRRVLNSIPHETPVRILTHSHGGKIASVALWNVTSSLDQTVEVWRNWYDSLRNDPVRYSTPTHPDIRLAMIAPAMPGNVIGDHADPDSSSTPAGGRVPIDRLVVGQNRRDRIVMKAFIFGLPLPASFGSTTLGGSPSEYPFYSPRFNRPGEPPVAFCVDFSHSPGPNPKEHAWTSYMQREAVGEALDLLFLDGVPAQQYPCRGGATD